MGHPFSLSYGVSLPSSLTRVLPRALGSSPRLPVSVYGTGTLITWLEAFLGSVGSASSLLKFRSPSRLGSTQERICLSLLPTRLDALNQRCAVPTLLRHPFTHNGVRWHWNINQLSIAYAFRPRLRSRLTLSGRTFLRKP